MIYMLRSLKKILLVMTVVAAVRESFGFSLNGLAPAWQTTAIGYNWEVVARVSTIGGPMNLGEEYRWNLPVIFYGVDSSFLNYFGQRGVEEIDKAAKIINDLPAMSQVNIDDYPLKTERINYQAQALGLLDLKTAALQSLIQEFGLGDPEEYVFTLRLRETLPAATNYYVIQRNFDPATLRPTAYINGDLWTYSTIVDNGNVPIAYPVNTRVDPLAYGDPVASSQSSLISTVNGVGLFYTGLTRDDVGGLRYLYHPLNKNVENPAPGVFSGLGGAVAVLGGGGAAVGSPWEPLFLSSSNGTPTLIGGGSFANSPFAPVFIPNSNNVANAGVGGATGGAVAANTNNFINTGLRSGIDKLRLVRVQFDSILGQFVSPVISSYEDTIITNGIPVTQTLQRIITTPDILFTAADLMVGGQIPGIMVARNETFTNNVAINQQTRDPFGVINSGPGTINPGVIITFNNAGPINFNIADSPFLSEENPGAVWPIWGSFDGTTNAPVVYPLGTSIEDIERQVLGGR